MRMSIAMIAVCLLVSLPTTVFSQALIGVMGGVNNTSLSGDTPAGTAYTGRLGFVASAVADIPLGDDIRLSFQPGYARLGTGVSMTFTLREPRDTVDISMDYLVLPILGRVIAKNGVTFVTGGLQGAALVRATSTPASGGADTDISKAIADFDVALILGAGAQISLSGSLTTIEVRYIQSLLNAGKTTEASEFFGMPPRFRLSGFQLIAGVLFSL